MGKWTRRGFITAGVAASGALIVGVAIRPGHRVPGLKQHVEGDGEALVNAWVKVGQDNKITAIIPQSEMGQGVMTALGMMLAEEMDADWSHFEMEQAPAIAEYANPHIIREFLIDDYSAPGFVDETLSGAFLTLAKSMGFQITGGSFSVRGTGTLGMQVAGAAAREMIIDVAAEQWGVDAASLRTENSKVFHDTTGRSANYADFAEAAGANKPPSHPKLKDPKTYRLIGTSQKRVDIPAKVTGTATFGIDTKLPGMKYAAVSAPSTLGNKVASVDDSAARAMPGVQNVIVLDDVVAVVADGYWQAKQALAALNIKSEITDADGLDSAGIFAQYRSDLDAAGDSDGDMDHSQGDVADAFKNARGRLEAEYQVPFLAHATMEPLNATAWVHDGKCEIWSGTQNPLGSRNNVAETIGFDPENVIMHNVFLGGGFGRRAYPDFTDMAARLAVEMPGTPIKMIWSREEDMQHDFYRPSAISRFRAALDENGSPTAWDNVFVHKHDPSEASLIPYEINNQLIRSVESPTHIRFGPWRSVDHSQHGFFIESFVDELAAEANADPYEYRKKLLTGQPQMVAVLDAAARLGNWGTELPDGHGRGIALVKAFGTIVAQVAEVAVENDGVAVKKVACVADPGTAVNPDSFVAQMESGIIYGLTAAMYGNITVRDGGIEQSNFHDYEMIRMDTAPDISVEIINSGGIHGGAGEPGTPPIAPAVTNAIFAAVGRRIRTLPIAENL